MLNKVMIIGRLGRDPELRYTQSGAPVATLNVATDESYTDRDGNKVERTEWHRVSVFQRQAENCANYLTKGSLVYVEGSLQTRKWQDQQGQDRYTTEIKAQRVQFLDRKGDREGGGRGYDEEYGNQSAPRGNAPRGGQGGYGQGNAPRGQAAHGGERRPPRQQQPQEEELGPAFPSEASNMDDVPF
ncbi:single-stranded DNA-binding protein [uncultured Desulfovibrio sp.]|uniref:single-stranded DNA-binding protein n=1 Tax=uncultured Desulfovibrio sp. TaxID=167968 RepID=UPI002637A9B5|nr:single-stranded DNA-binding protein [uncultured Desulfovibrio sp.]